MSLNALPASQLALKSATSAVAGTVYTFYSSNYAGCSSPVYDEIIGKTGALVAGTITIPLSIRDIPSAALAAACIVEAWLNNTDTGAGTATVGAKYAGFLIFTGGVPDTVVLRLRAFAEDGAIAAGFTGTLGFRVLIPRAL
jgi:hypothetical protein